MPAQLQDTAAPSEAGGGKCARADGSGYVNLKLLAVSASPHVVHPGHKVYIKARYKVDTAFPAQQVEIKERRQVFFAGHPIGAPKVSTFMRQDGTYSTVASIQLPPITPIGHYIARVTVSGAGKTRVKIAHFTVH